MKTLLLSYPRSGNTWLRYIIETILEKPTIGYQRMDSVSFDRNSITGLNGIPIVIKRHEPENCDKLLFIVRNYKECIIRHENENIPGISDRVLLKGLPKYLKNIGFYDSFNKPKHMVYYFELINDPFSVILGVMEFLTGNDHRIKVKEFCKNLEFHKKRCIDVYQRHAKSFTGGNHIKYHSDILTKEDKLRWDRIVCSCSEGIYAKYLYKFKEL